MLISHVVALCWSSPCFLYYMYMPVLVTILDVQRAYMYMYIMHMVAIANAIFYSFSCVVPSVFLSLSESVMAMLVAFGCFGSVVSLLFPLSLSFCAAD